MKGHGGRRKGAGRPAGSGWRPAVAEMRTAAAERLVATVGSARDPMEIVLQIAADEEQDVQTRLGACAIAMPYLYPRLSATTVDARTTNVTLDATELLSRLNERIARIASPDQPLIETEPEKDNH